MTHDETRCPACAILIEERADAERALAQAQKQVTILAASCDSFKERLAQAQGEIERLKACLAAANGVIAATSQDILRAQVERVKLLETLEFYADPATYAAIGFFPDPPCGEFADDFDDPEDPDYPGMRPGKRARAALTEPGGQP